MAQRYQGGILGVGFNPLQAPDAPTIGTALAGNTTVSVAFTPPANVGGSAISSYAVRVSPGNFSATGSVSPINVTGLTNDVAYTFSVAALNSYGPSPYSGTVTATPSILVVEDVFSTWLYTGNGSTQTIANGINLSGQGGMVWLKRRDAATNNLLYDTARGPLNKIESDGTAGQGSFANSLTAFNSNGFTLGDALNINGTGVLGGCSWTFRESPKFFDVVTYTGNGATGRQIAHNLGVAPGCVIIKKTSATSAWPVWHRSTGFSFGLALNTTESLGTTQYSPVTAVSATTITLDTRTESSGSTNCNENGTTYVAYLWAHDAASDGIIQCGSYSGSGSAGNTVTLGWEPQWVLIKNTTSAQFWGIYDNMRGMPVGSNDALLLPNSSGAEQSYEAIQPTATGFQLMNGNPDTNGVSQTYIYIAIRRGPMRTPTVGTSVFSPVYQTFSGSAVTNTNFVVDMVINKTGVATTSNNFVLDRLRGSNNGVNQNTIPSTSSTSAEVASSGRVAFTSSSATGYVSIQYGFLEQDTNPNNIVWAFGRAPGFFDQVCYTGTGSSLVVNHNLGVVPELMIFKRRNAIADWLVFNQFSNQLPFGQWYETFMNLNGTGTPSTASNVGLNFAPTSTSMEVKGGAASMNVSGGTYVAYLFASCPGVSKVGSYTGTGTTQTINCGFTTGARFVLIKRTDSTGDWYVWDSARGIVSGNDPYLLLNNTSPQVTNTDYIDANNSGFQIDSSAPAAINANGGTYIFLAIS